jgi:signal transduction histidine kinase/ligand-binding sensor domain-containing protein
MSGFATAGDGAQSSGVPARQAWTLDHFQHRAFTVNDGLPADGTTLIAQTADGLIWLSTPTGLMTFDGKDFRPFTPLAGEKLLATDIEQLFAPASGGLWVKYHTSGTTLIKDGHITNFPRQPNKPEHRIIFFFQDRDGAAWGVANKTHFVKFVNGRWTMTAYAVPEPVRAVTTDAEFNVWVVAAQSGRIYRRRPQEVAFSDMGLAVAGASGISVPGTAQVFVSALSQETFRYRVVGNALTSCGPPLPGFGAKVLADPMGGAWMATVTDGLHYFPSLDALCPPSPRVADNTVYLGNKASGASGDIVLKALVDKEGNIWGTSEGGLDRYTPSAFSAVRFPKSINMATTATGPDGTLWVGSEAMNVYHYVEGVAADSGAARTSLALTGTKDGVLAASVTGVWALSGTHSQRVRSMPDGVRDTYALSIYQEPEQRGGRIWLAVDNRVFRTSGNRWETVPGAGSAMSIYGDAAGTVWVPAVAPDTLYAYAATGTKTWSHADGLDVGGAKVVLDNVQGIWIAGERGVQLLDAGRFRRLAFADTQPPNLVTGLATDDDGNLWIHAANGLYQVGKSDIDAFTSARQNAVKARVFGPGDGLLGIASQGHSVPSILKGADGRLWVQGGTQVSWIEPRDLPVPPTPSSPIIEGVSVGSHRFDIASGVVALPRDERSPVISFTAASTTDGARMRFQTRLDGFDNGWVEQGGRREVSYPHLAAGRYRFTVRASTDGKTWTSTPPSLALTVEPFFFETWWFRSGCVLAGLLVLWLLARWEINRTVRRYRATLRIRADEREAIARDLHDTLLQGNLALVLRLETIYQKAGEAHTRESLHALAESANRVVTEGRKRLTALRDAEDDAGSLAVRLDKLGRALGEDAGVTFSLEVSGKPRMLDFEASDELRLLLAEAITNAFRHSGADVVKVVLDFGRRQLSASVKDDGRGFPPGTLEQAREGHWGVTGMRERAAKLHARFSIRPGTPSGTEVFVVVPARRAYGRSGLWPFDNRSAAIP